MERTLRKIRFFEVLLTSTFVFLLFNLIFFIFDISRIFAVLIAMAYLLIRMVSKTDFLKIVDNFGFKDKLKAAWDNRNLKSIVMEYLALEVLEELNYIKLSPHVKKGKATLLVLGCVILSFATIYVSTNDTIITESKKARHFAKSPIGLVFWTPIRLNRYPPGSSAQLQGVIAVRIHRRLNKSHPHFLESHNSVSYTHLTLPTKA